MVKIAIIGSGLAGISTALLLKDHAEITLFEKARGGAGTPTIVNNNDDIGMIHWSGYDGDNYEQGAYIYGEVDGTPADGDMPMRLVFATRKAGAASGAGRLIIDNNGYITTPARPYFSANGNPSITSNIVNDFANVHNNNGSHYNNTTGKFTAPVAGFYWFSAGIWQNSASSGTNVLIQITYHNGSSSHAIAGANAPAIDYVSMNCSGGVYMVTGGTVYISATQVSVRASTPRNYFCGYLVG